MAAPQDYQEQLAEEQRRKAALAASQPGMVDPSKLVQQRGVDPTAQALIRGFAPRRSAADNAQDAADAARIQADSFGARVGGFAPTKPGYHDDASLPMAERMSAFNNRTTRAGAQEITQPGIDARAKAGLTTNVGTPPVGFDLNRLTVDHGKFDPITGVQRQDKIGYNTAGQPSGMGTPGVGVISYDENPNHGAPIGVDGAHGTSQYGTVGVSFPGQAVDVGQLVQAGNSGARTHTPDATQPVSPITSHAMPGAGGTPTPAEVNAPFTPPTGPITSGPDTGADHSWQPADSNKIMTDFWNWLAKVSPQGQTPMAGGPFGTF